MHCTAWTELHCTGLPWTSVQYNKVNWIKSKRLRQKNLNKKDLYLEWIKDIFSGKMNFNKEGEKKHIILKFCTRSYKRYWFKNVKVVVSLKVMVHCSPGFKPPNPIFFFMPLLVSVLISASFERFGVSLMRDFYLLNSYCQGRMSDDP